MRNVVWFRGLNAKLGGGALAMAVLATAVVVGNLAAMASMTSDAATLGVMESGRFLFTNAAHLANLTASATGDQRAADATLTRSALQAVDERYADLLDGEGSLGVPPLADQTLRDRLAQSRAEWLTRYRPVIERSLAAGSPGEARAALAPLNKALPGLIAEIEQTVALVQANNKEDASRFQLLQYAFVAGAALAFGFVVWTTRGFIIRTQVLAATARRIAAGDPWLTVPVRGSDEIAVAGTAFNDMTESLRRTIRTELAGRQQLRVFEATIEHAVDAVVITDTGFNGGGHRILLVNRAYTELTGRTAEEVRGESPRIAQGPRTDPAVNARIRDALGRGLPIEVETVNYRKDGTAYEVELYISPIRDEAGVITNFVSIQRNITERKQAERQLQHVALHDSLTDLPNRVLFVDRLAQAILATRRAERSAALLLLDLNGFKEVNDTFGHDTGDELLRLVGSRLRAEVREIDTVSRLGGDEFAVVLPGAGASAAELVAQKLLRALERPFVINDQTLDAAGSIGISVFPDHGDEPAPLLRCADIAMYAAKRTGSGHAVYALAHDPHSPEQLAVVASLRRAISDGELVLHYQPIVTMATGGVAAVEALVRWQHPTRGLVPPGDFIGVAERTALIRPLTTWVLRAAIAQARAWGAPQRGVPIAVNLSMRNLLDPDLPLQIETMLREAGVAPSRLSVEITESSAMAEPARTIATLARLARHGVVTAIDDFGTGYSSLAYLQRLPVRTVKVDRSFVSRLTNDAGSAAIVRATIDLAHDLGLRVVAEGVEDAAAWDRLLEMGCDQAQGVLICRPLPPAALEPWLDRNAER